MYPERVDAEVLNGLANITVRLRPASSSILGLVKVEDIKIYRVPVSSSLAIKFVFFLAENIFAIVYWFRKKSSFSKRHALQKAVYAASSKTFYDFIRFAFYILPYRNEQLY